MVKADEEEKPEADAAGTTSIDADLGPRDPLEQNSQSYSTVTDLARLRGWSTLAPRLTAM
jgi:hypothetical protein